MRHGIFHVYLESKRKRIFAIACLGKKLVFHTEISNYRLLFAYSTFKNIEISSGQGVVQIQPNSVWSVPCVPKM